MESVTLKEQQQQQSTTTTADGLAKKTKISISFPTELIDEIVSRLPVKSILRFRSVCKPWLSRFSEPSFINLHLIRATVSHRYALFITAYDISTGKRYFLSAARDGGSVTHLMTLDFDFPYNKDITEAQHSNGLVLSTSRNLIGSYNLFVFNPSTHKMFQLPKQASLPFWNRNCFNRYLFGFDESRNEHKILNIMVHNAESYYHDPSEPTEVKIMIFSMSSYSWRMIDAEPPIGFSWNRLHHDSKGSVCVNSVVYLLLRRSGDILAFDLRTDKFSKINLPRESLTWNGISLRYDYHMFRILKINGCVGVVCHHYLSESIKMYIWMLQQDCENHVWVKEIIEIPTLRRALDFPFPLDDVNMDEIIFFFMSRVSSNHEIGVPIYNKKSKCFKTLKFTSGHQFPLSRDMIFDHISCYVESMLPL